jgi:predicted ATPase
MGEAVAPMTTWASTCECDRPQHQTRRIVLTGGPGAGKTAVLELVRATACRHVRVLPEAASILFGGGFPRHDGDEGRRALQRAIFHVQRELEALAEDEGAAILLCDRGTLDGLAYWPGAPEDFWAGVQSTRDAELQRYSAVIHLRTPGSHGGYNHANPARTESARTAALIDERIADAWSAHPHVTTIPASGDFLVKANAALEIIRSELPRCCRSHVRPAAASAS